MKALKYLLAGGAGLAALAAASPAAAQYYPPQPYGGNVLGQVLGQILNPGYGYGYGGGLDSRVLVDRCAAAVTDRVNRQYGYAYNGPYGGYGYNGSQGGARVVAITNVEQRSRGRLRVRGIAQGSAYSAGYGYNGAPQEFTFRCDTDYRGYISNIDVDRRSNRYSGGYGYSPYQPYGQYPRY